MGLTERERKIVETHEMLHAAAHAAFQRRRVCRANAASPFGPWDAQCGEWAFELLEPFQPCRDPEAEALAAAEEADRAFDAGEFSLRYAGERSEPCGPSLGSCRVHTPEERNAFLDARIDAVLAKAGYALPKPDVAQDLAVNPGVLAAPRRRK